MSGIHPPRPNPFLGVPVASDIGQVTATHAVLGVAHGVAYDPGAPPTTAASAPQVVRERSARYAAFASHHDFDLKGPLLPADRVLVDVGDVATDPRDPLGNRQRTEAAVGRLIAQGVVPLVLGGDDSVPASVIAAYEAHGPITVVQVDAHIDFRDEIGGERWGYSSPMRRASDMPWVERVVHVGARGVGSARREELDETLVRGNVVVTAREVHEKGAAAALRHVPAGTACILAVDIDGFDPSVAPGTAALAHGGLTYQQGIDLVRGLERDGRRLAGASFVEYYPDKDVNGLTALLVVRLVAAAVSG